MSQRQEKKNRVIAIILVSFIIFTLILWEASFLFN